MTIINFQPVTNQNWRDTLPLSVYPAQQRFVSDFSPIALVGLAKAYVRPRNLIWQPYAIYANDLMIGFLELAYKPSQNDNYWLHHFFIDQHHQGQGYGKRALNAFIEFVKNNHPACQCIFLTVHSENMPAQHLYTKAGFKPTGEEAFGEPVYRFALDNGLG